MFNYELQDREDYAALRSFLERIGYTEKRICERLGVSSIYRFESAESSVTATAPIESPVDALIRAFLNEGSLDHTVRDHFTEEDLDLLLRCNLLEADEEGRYRATVLLYPVEGFWIASDPARNVAVGALQQDAVYPALTEQTGAFLSSLPPGPHGRVLELCSGTGIAALLAAGEAEEVWAVDVAERSTRSAKFNARLNGVDNVSALTGDLYGPVQGKAFDRILAHPPYVPAPVQRLIYRDGGPDGEDVIRGILGGAADHLAPGGQLDCTCVVSDRTGEPAEDRVRAMLGERNPEFDVLVAVQYVAAPRELLANMVEQDRSTHDVDQIRRSFDQNGVNALVSATITVRRARNRSQVFTARLQNGPRTTGREIAWFMDREAYTVGAEDADFLDIAPRRVPGVRVVSVQELGPEGWNRVEMRAGVKWPFQFESPCTPWAPAFLERCDGSRTVRDHADWLREQGAVPLETTDMDIANLTRQLLGKGFLDTDEYPLPWPTGLEEARETAPVPTSGA